MKEQIESLVKTMICGAIVAAAGVAAFLFAVVAAFLWAQQRYDTVVASAVAAAIFLLIAVIALVWLSVARRRADARRRREEAASTASATPAWLTDPAMLVAAVQIARTIGIGKLVPLLLTGAAAFGAASLMGGRSAAAKQRKTEPKSAKRAA